MLSPLEYYALGFLIYFGISLIFVSFFLEV